MPSTPDTWRRPRVSKLHQIDIGLLALVKKHELKIAWNLCCSCRSRQKTRATFDTFYVSAIRLGVKICNQILVNEK